MSTTFLLYAKEVFLPIPRLIFPLINFTTELCNGFYLLCEGFGLVGDLVPMDKSFSELDKKSTYR